ncbi:MAG TPA: hypothetical protein ENN09_01460, partial [Planctomycetes bacterium]|nr:hypothetical protein [Planctomycetota bacterium]
MREGLSDRTSAGRAGSYGVRAGTETLLLSTAVARGAELWTVGEKCTPLGGLDCSGRYSRSRVASSWTGRSSLYNTEWSAVEVHLRTTLPGPLFVLYGRSLRLRFEFGNAPNSIRDMEKGKKVSFHSGKQLGRALLLEGGRMPALIVASRPVERLDTLTHEHMELVFGEAGAHVMWVPLLKAADAPRGEAVKDWIRLVSNPPMRCTEYYEVEGDEVHIRQCFTDAEGRPSAYAPIPPLAALPGNSGGLQGVPAGKRLLDTLIGPYRVVKGASWSGSIKTGWRRARPVGRRPVDGPLERPPAELAYAGDVTWEPRRNPMDRLMELVVWAPLAAIAPQKLWKRIRRMLRVPTADALRRLLVEIEEPAVGRVYAKPGGLFHEAGDVSYDTDWYNGKILTGMRRALESGDTSIRDVARRLVRRTVSERRLLCAYMEIYHDWALGAAWSDPRGEGWNIDCVHW